MAEHEVVEETCKKCQGKGKHRDDSPCKACAGTGKFKKYRIKE